MKLSIIEELCYSTVRIECKNSSGQVQTGTGFFFGFKKSEKESIPILITNKHVVKDMLVGKFIMTIANPDGTPNNTKHFPVKLTNLQSFIRYHPDNEVDLCAMAVAPILNYAKANGINVFIRVFDKSKLPTNEQLEEFTALEEILMIGYPNGIWDSVNNMPILRRGITATHPSIDYNGKKEFLIDAACFPGSSGSPVLIYNTGVYSSKSGNIVMSSQPRVILVGILYAGPQHTATGEIKVINVPTTQQPIALSRIPNNLGIVIKAERIIELEQLFQ